MKILDYIALIILVIVFVCAFYKEAKMLGVTKSGWSIHMPSIYTTDPHSNQLVDAIESHPPHSFSELFAKINHTVYWRRCFILSLIIVLMIAMMESIEITPQKMLVSIVVSACILFLSFTFYRFHYLDVAVNYLDQYYTLSRKGASSRSDLYHKNETSQELPD